MKLDIDRKIAGTDSGKRERLILTETLDHARHIALSLLRTFADRPSYVLGITSARPNEGKTTISQALSEVMATDFGLEVMLVDANAERPWPQVDEELGQVRGLTDWLTGFCDLPDAVLHVHDKRSELRLGTQHLVSRDLLQYFVKANALQQLRDHYGLIILDLPDLVNPAAPALANLCDGVVLVIEAGETPVDAVTEFLPILQNVTVHGVVLNRHRPSTPETLRRLFA